MTRKGQGQAGKSVCGSRSGSRSVGSMGRHRHGCCSGHGPSSKTSTSTLSHKKGWSWMAKEALQEHMAASAPRVLSKLAPSPGSHTPIAVGGWREKWRNALTALTNHRGKIRNDVNVLCTGVSGTRSCHRLRNSRAGGDLCGALAPTAAQSRPPPPGCCGNTPHPVPCFCFAAARDIPGRACCTPLSCGPGPALLPGSHSAPSGPASPGCTSSDSLCGEGRARGGLCEQLLCTTSTPCPPGWPASGLETSGFSKNTPH